MHSLIELLETRIAPAAVFTFTDVDGDTVKITSSKGTNDDLAAAATVTSGQLVKLDVGAATWMQKFKGANITIAVTTFGLNGDGIVNVGFIDGIGIDLGKVVVGGDLGKILGGASTKGGVKSLTVSSLGQLGVITGAPNNASAITGSGALTVLGDIDGGSIAYTAKLSALTVGGSLRGNAIAASGAVFADSAGNVKIAGGIFGGSGATSGSLVINGTAGAINIGGDIEGVGVNTGAVFVNKAASFTLGGDMVGGTQSSSGTVSLTDGAKKISIGGSIQGGAGTNAGTFIAGPSGAVTIGGRLIGAGGGNSGAVLLDTAGAITITGDIVGGGAFNAGCLIVGGKSAKITITGSLIGGTNSNTGTVIADDTGAVVIGQDLQGNTGNNAGTLLLEKAASVTIGGSMVGGPGNASGSLFLDTAAKITVLGSITGGSFDSSGSIGVSQSIGTLSIGGDLTSVLIRVNNGPGLAKKSVVASAISVSGNVSSSLFAIGNFQNPDAQIGKFSVGGNWTASNLVVGVQNLGTDDAPGGVGAAADNVNFGDPNDVIIAGGSAKIVSSIASITIGGRITGTVGGTDHFGFSAEKIGAFKVGGFVVSLNKNAPDVIPIGPTGDVAIRETAVLV